MPRRAGALREIDTDYQKEKMVMLAKTVTTCLAAIALAIGSALMPTNASAADPHGGGGGHGGFGGPHVAAGGPHVGAGRIGPFRGVEHRHWAYPWWGPYAYYYEPWCGYVLVKYYRHKRVHWRWVYECP